MQDRVMPRFYFDYGSGGEVASDDTGTDLANVADAQAEALAAAGEWIKDRTAAGASAELRLSVRDGNSAPLFVVTACVKIGRDPE
jgi:hypothetical protein